MKRHPRRLATLDCETDPFKLGRIPKPFLWIIYDGTTYYEFEHVSDCIHFLSNQRWVVYAHNGGRFDYHQPGFLDELSQGQEITVINGRLARFRIGECEFRDSVNILPIRLGDYQKDVIDYRKLEPEVRKLHMPEIIRYCRSDCRYLYNIVSKFRETHGTGLTLAGAAMRTWQNISKIEAPRSTAGFYHAISPPKPAQTYYTGGRVECFVSGIIDRPFRMVDINSAYPYAMLHEHPLHPSSRDDVPAISDPIVPQALYEVDAISRGALPYREKDGLSFPDSDSVQRFRATGWEIQAGIDTGTLKVEKIIRRKSFDKKVKFTQYILRFYAEKAASPKGSAEYIFAKLFMNSLYGKFGANPEEYNSFYVYDSKFYTHAVAEGKQWAGRLGGWNIHQEALPPERQRFYNVATAASITGFVRAYLWRALCAIKKGGGQLLYCDTDSIAFAGDMPRELPCGRDLGEWSDDGVFVRGGVGGKKLYAFQSADGKWKIGCKGVRITPKEIMDVCAGQTVKYEKESPSYGMGRTPTFLVRNVKMTAKVGSR